MIWLFLLACMMPDGMAMFWRSYWNWFHRVATRWGKFFIRAKISAFEILDFFPQLIDITAERLLVFLPFAEFLQQISILFHQILVLVFVNFHQILIMMRCLHVLGRLKWLRGFHSFHRRGCWFLQWYWLDINWRMLLSWQRTRWKGRSLSLESKFEIIKRATFIELGSRARMILS